MTDKRIINILVSVATIAGAAGIFTLVLMYPWTIALSGHLLRKLLFALVVFSAGLGFVYGLGFRPGTGTASRMLLSPVTVLLLITVSLGWIGYALSIGPSALQG